MFIPKLAATPRARVPFDLEIFFIKADFFGGFGINDGNGYS